MEDKGSGGFFFLKPHCITGQKELEGCAEYLSTVDILQTFTVCWFSIFC